MLKSYKLPCLFRLWGVAGVCYKANHKVSSACNMLENPFFAGFLFQKPIYNLC